MKKIIILILFVTLFSCNKAEKKDDTVQNLFLLNLLLPKSTGPTAPLVLPECGKYNPSDPNDSTKLLLRSYLNIRPILPLGCSAKTISISNGVVYSFTLNASGFPEKITTTNTSVSSYVSATEITYSSLNYPVQKKDTCRSFTGTAVTDFSFDSLGRISGVSFSGINCSTGNTTSGSIVYSYSGNNLYFSKSESSSGSTENRTYTFDSNNKITKISYGSSSLGESNYTYDTQGNLFRASDSILPSYIFFYDSSNRLINMANSSVSFNTSTIDTDQEYMYTFDSSGKISTVTFRDSQIGSTTVLTGTVTQ